MHELGHLLGAIHPGTDSQEDEFEVPKGTQGVMCKDTCKVDTVIEPFDSLIGNDDRSSILTAEYYSEPNKDRILGIDYDHRDRGDPGNKARNLTSVSTATNGGE